MGCEQLVQHAKVSKNRKFIPHFRENLARPLDKGGVGVVYLPCNPQSAASVREVINTANRLIHRVTAEVINPFQQLSTLYRHVVDTSPPPRVHRRSGLQPRHSIAVLLFAVPLLCCTEASLSFSRFTAAPLYRCSVSSLYSGIAPPVFPSRLCRFAASPVSAPSARKPFPALCFSFSGMPLPLFPGCLSARRRLRPATRRPRQRSPRRGGSSPLRTRNPVPHLGSGDSTPGGRIAAPAAQPHRNAGWRGGASEG